MQVIEIRPARVSAALVAIGDMLVASPIGATGPRPSQWVGAVTEHIIVEGVDDPAEWRQWRIALLNGQSKESAIVPADGWVWVHLPIVEGPVERPRVMPTVDGTRGHRVSTPEEDEQRRLSALLIEPGFSAEDIERYAQTGEIGGPVIEGEKATQVILDDPAAQVLRNVGTLSAGLTAEDIERYAQTGEIGGPDR